MHHGSALFIFVGLVALGCSGQQPEGNRLETSTSAKRTEQHGFLDAREAEKGLLKLPIDVPVPFAERLKGITAGMEREKVEAILSTVRTVNDPVIGLGVNDELRAVYRLNDRWEAETTFVRNRLVSLCVRRARNSGWAAFSDLRPSIPTAVYDSVVLIHQSPPLRALDFNPAPLIRAVNHLREQGLSHSIEALTCYHNLVTNNVARAFDYNLNEDKLFPIMALLFITKQGEPLVPHLGITALRQLRPPDNLEWPIFPVICADGIPFLLPPRDPRTSLRGGARLEAGLAYCKANCVLRPDPLLPNRSPVEAVEHLQKDRKWKALLRSINDPALQEQFVVGVLRVQALLALSDSYPLSQGERILVSPSAYRSSTDANENWERHVLAVATLRPQWDSTRNSFRNTTIPKEKN